eukprot:CAMPEP_0181214776 /NCGR_PEP_ID=MMETSP1096-20121128/25646_1 /TAXON_ID=156174 ORGANISM="Chrysochromulina ericina, Strain CCMP281" /NCGR_SAMPLE_ID=MMETSP1096 /ASSEMBLY_ACC=CAM_ASM_000453 /LENGTH=132 /DNA_ID=CAMNT_0023306559 /DNA_START=554 /DNA_END=949 /DNA_ORIENTATION=-
MASIWRLQYGHLTDSNTAPILIGEWGGVNTGQDAVWQAEFARYLSHSRIAGSFYWCLNPDSADTGGLLKTSIVGDDMVFDSEDAKLELLKQIPATIIPSDRIWGDSPDWRDPEHSPPYVAPPPVPPPVLPPL